MRVCVRARVLARPHFVSAFINDGYFNLKLSIWLSSLTCHRGTEEWISFKLVQFYKKYFLLNINLGVRDLFELVSINTPPLMVKFRNGGRSGL